MRATDALRIGSIDIQFLTLVVRFEEIKMGGCRDETNQIRAGYASPTWTLNRQDMTCSLQISTVESPEPQQSISEFQLNISISVIGAN